MGQKDELTRILEVLNKFKEIGEQIKGLRSDVDERETASKNGDSFTDMIKSLMSKENIQIEEVAQNENEHTNGEECLCESCADYENFEKEMGEKGGKVSYTNFEVGGKQFDVKYWTDGEDEDLIIRSKKTEKQKVESNLRNELKDALTDSDYAKASEIIEKLKNSK